MDSSFFQRLIGLTTTHFGMSTPVINEERQARAFAILGESRRIAEEAERTAAKKIAAGESTPKGHGIESRLDNVLYEFELIPTPPDRDTEPAPARTAVRVPLILPAGVNAIQLEENGKPIPAALTDLIRSRMDASVVRCGSPLTLILPRPNATRCTPQAYPPPLSRSHV